MMRTVIRNRGMVVALRSSSLLFLAGLALGAESGPTTSPSTQPSTRMVSPTFSELVERAEAYSKQRHPGIKFDFTLPARVTRHQEYWEVTWIFTNPRMAGGMPIIRLDRTTLEVVSAEFQE